MSGFRQHSTKKALIKVLSGILLNKCQKTGKNIGSSPAFHPVRHEICQERQKTQMGYQYITQFVQIIFILFDLKSNKEDWKQIFG